MSAFIRIVLLFFIYSFIGWLWETVFCSIKAKHFVYRGFLVGPITPIYGFGILMVLYFLRPFHDQLILLYIFAAVIVTILEYFTSFALEKLFHASWWDYHDVWGNINGRVAIPVSLFWGLACVFIVKALHPWVLLLEERLATAFGFYLPVVLIAVIMFDLGYTLANLTAFQNAVKRLNQEVEARKQEVQESITDTKDALQTRLEWTNYLRQHPDIKESLPRLDFNQRRLLKNFNHLRLQNVKSIDDLRELVENLKKNR